MSEAVKSIISELADGLTPTGSALESAFDAILSGTSDPVQISAFLMGLRMKGETVDDLLAGARVMRAHARKVEAPPNVVDTCGTGGLPFISLNTSTAAAIVAAAAGAVVAKHGNRSVPPKTGSADVLEALGVNLNVSEGQLAQCLEQAGIAFMFAQAHHSAMRHVAPVRKTLGIRTIFNLLGPLSNPAGAKFQVMGVFDKSWSEKMASVLNALGAQHAWIVHGEDGLDEITTTGETFVVEIKEGNLSSFSVTPESVGLQRHSLDTIKGGNVAFNADAIKAILSGEKNAFRDIVALNAGASLFVCGVASSYAEGVEIALAAIDSGKAAETLATLIRVSNEAA